MESFKQKNPYVKAFLENNLLSKHRLILEYPWETALITNNKTITMVTSVTVIATFEVSVKGLRPTRKNKMHVLLLKYQIYFRNTDIKDKNFVNIWIVGKGCEHD